MRRPFIPRQKLPYYAFPGYPHGEDPVEDIMLRQRGDDDPTLLYPPRQGRAIGGDCTNAITSQAVACRRSAMIGPETALGFIFRDLMTGCSQL